MNSPTDCGMCGTACAGSQYCSAGKCACRPGLTACNGVCTDLLHNVLNCGACGTQCNFAAGQRCVDGVCQNGNCANINRTFCNGGCYTQAQFNSDPLNCGRCGNACARNQVCVAGACTNYFTSASCTTCPCPACGVGTSCCKFPGAATTTICVAGNTCPQ
jgi:hypothetical protein